MYDLKGKNFGLLTVLERCGSRHKEVLWRCECECGKVTEVISSNLRTGHTLSCGCEGRRRASEANRKHGMFGTRIYSIW